MKIGGAVILVIGAFFLFKYGFGSDAGSTGATSSALTDVTEKDWVKGKADASVTLLEYTDFQCPACGAYYPIVKQLMDEKGDQLRLVIREYPLIQIHKNALTGARAAEAAGKQGKFWEMYDLLFANQAEWSNADDPMKSIVPSYAGRIGLNIEQFRQDMTDAAIDDKITHDRKTGDDLKITGTPTFFLNGKQIDLKNIRSFDDFKKIVEKAVADSQK